MIINNKMQSITQKLAYYFGNVGRVPSIKFLGPRSLIQQNHPKAETHNHHTQKPKAPSKSSLSGPSVKFTDFSTKL